MIELSEAQLEILDELGPDEVEQRSAQLSTYELFKPVFTWAEYGDKAMTPGQVNALAMFAKALQTSFTEILLIRENAIYRTATADEKARAVVQAEIYRRERAAREAAA